MQRANARFLKCKDRAKARLNSTSADIIAVVRQLVLIANDELIAGLLNRNGLTMATAGPASALRRCAHTITSRTSDPPRKVSNLGSIFPMPPVSCRLRPRRCGWRQRRVKSRRSIHCPIGLGSLLAPPLLLTPPQLSPNGRVRTRDTRRIASRPTKPIVFKDITRWVFQCAIVEIEVRPDRGECFWRQPSSAVWVCFT